MAEVKSITYSVDTGWEADADQATAFFNSFNSSLFSASLYDPTSMFVNIENNMLIKYYFGVNNQNHSIMLSVNGGDDTWIGDTTTYGGKSFRIVASDSFLYIFHTNYYPHVNIFLYEKIDNKIYYGYSHNTGAGSITSNDIMTPNLIELGGSAINYKHYKRLNYTAPEGYIDFSKENLFDSGLTSVTTVSNPELLSCSTIAKNSTITIGGKNYYSLSTNTLIEITTS